MKKNRRWMGSSALLAALAVAAGACSSGTAGTPGSDQAATTAVARTGGMITVGAEQEPDCLDWISSCAASSWGVWMVQANTMPRAYDVVADGDGWAYTPSPLLDGEADVAAGDAQVVTYRLNPAARWSDGTPITCGDLRYTWEQITTGEDIYDTTGYASIASVDDRDPRRCVVTFSEPYAPWKSLFGGGYGVYPAHLLEGNDRAALMADGYDFSGGPFALESWEKGVGITIVRNDAYWAANALPDKVVFKFMPDSAAQFAALRAGEVDAIYPQPQLDVVSQMKSLPGVQRFVSTDTGNFEGLWMNNAAAPLDSVKVRQAIAYGLDRSAIVKRLFGDLGIDRPLDTLNGPFFPYKDPDAFGRYGRDLVKVDELMTSDGWTRGADGIWVKDGERATLEFKTTAGNQRRELTQQVIQQQLGQAGFEIVIANQKPADLFGRQLPSGDHQLTLYAQASTSLDQGRCDIFCTKNIPSEANGWSGLNQTWTSVPELDAELEVLDHNPDSGARMAAGKRADALMAEHMISLPLDPLPSIGLVSKRIAGVEDNPIYSIFGSLSKWGFVQ